MSYRKLLHSVVGITLVIAFAVGCASPPTAAPPSEAPAATATPVPPPATPTPTLALPPNTPAAMPAPVEAATVTSQPAQEQLRVDIQLFMLNSQALAGNLLRDDTKRPVQVILPPGYAASDKRYPVLYYLHGGGPDAMTLSLDTMQDMWQHWHEEIENASGDFIAYVEQGMQRGEIQDMILVFPNAGNLLTGSWYLSSPTIGDYETYLSQELVDYVDSHYRTLPQRESRGISGCSVGGDGAAHLGLKYPDVYAVVVAQSGFYFWDRSPGLLEGVKEFTGEPADYSEFSLLSGWVQGEIALAAGVAPNPSKPPFYLDMPFVMVDGVAEIAPGFVEKVKTFDPRADVERYLAQPTRLNALLVQHGANDDLLPVELARDFDKLLTEKGIAHEFDDAFITHCSYDMVPPMLKFMSDHLVGE
jgi:S-formylglutathione hydrolase FrmB